MKTENFSLKNPILVHGHRGSRGTHPENTLPAFEEAITAGADVLEFDLQLSLDDVPVVSHDPSITGKLCRDASGMMVRRELPIRKLRVAEIKTYDCGSVLQSRFPDQKRIPGTKIPTLEEVIEWVLREAPPKTGLNIETKMTADKPELTAPPDLFARRVIEILRKHQILDRTILQSFDFWTLAAAKKLEPTLKLACLFEKEGDFPEITLKQGCQIASPYYKLITLERVKQCHEKGIAVVPWTPNEETEWKELASLGVDAIITDYPRKLIEAMRNWK